MHGFSEREGRTIRIDGRKATIKGQFYAHDDIEKISLYNHLNGEKKILHNHKMHCGESGHGSGDSQLINGFLYSIRERKKHNALINASEILESHLMAFASEKSRLENRVIEMNSFRNKAQKL